MSTAVSAKKCSNDKECTNAMVDNNLYYKRAWNEVNTYWCGSSLVGEDLVLFSNVYSVSSCVLDSMCGNTVKNG
jgi:hypothetical protein